MGLKSIAIPGLIGGVSQQVPSMRHPTQSAWEENTDATLLEGLRKRPPLEWVSLLPITADDGGSALTGGTDEDSFFHVMDYGVDGRFLLVVRKSASLLPLVFNLETGAACSVVAPGGAAYLSCTTPRDALRAVTVADYTFLVNRTVTVGTATTDTFVNPTNTAYIHVRAAAPVANISAKIDGIQGSYATAGVPNLTVAVMTAGLRTALAAALGAGYTVTAPIENVVKVVKASGAITAMEAWDDAGNSLIQLLNNGVTKYADLPARFEAGYRVLVQGTADNNDDDYFVEWNGTRWVEARQPGLPDTLNPSTMPWTLKRTGTSSFTLEAATWDRRVVGGDTTNPLPKFAGTVITDVAFVRNRLLFLSPSAVSLSASGRYFRWFAETARTVLDGDPINLESPSSGSTRFDWATTFNEAVLVFGPNQQFAVAGGEVMSPRTASLTPVSAYEVASDIRPVFTGSRMLFAAPRSQLFCAVKSYRASADRVGNEAEDITAHVAEYIPRSLRALAVSATAQRIVAVPRSEGALYLFRYEEDDSGTFTQRAWTRLVLGPGQVPLAAYWVDQRLFVALHHTENLDGTTRRHVSLEVLDLSREHAWQSLPYTPRLDRLVTVTPTYDSANDRTLFTVPYRSAGTMELYRLASDAADPVKFTATKLFDTGPSTMRLAVPGDIRLAGALFFTGRVYSMLYRFTPMQLSDSNGAPVEAARVRVRQVSVAYQQTGYFQAEVTPYLRATYTYPLSGRVVGVPGLGLGQAPISSGTLQVPVGTRPFDSVVELKSDSFYPCRFPSAEWVADIQLRASR